MPRNYVRKTDNASYPLEKLLEAVRAVKSGRLSGYEASKHYGIPRSTIINRVYDRKGLKSSTLGRAAVLSREVEEDLVKNLRVMEKHGFGLTRQEVLETVGQYVSVNLVRNPFKNGEPGEDWFLSFKKRNNLSIKKPQPVEYARKQACSPYIIYPYFNLLEETVIELGLSDKPSHIWNVDETSFSKDPSKSKVVGCKGFTSTRTIASPGKDNTTILLGCNALGEKTPPMIVFKGKNVWDQWTSAEDYPGTAYAATSNGWMETPVFEAFFEKVFLKTVGQKRPILLLYDGHATHVGINLIKKAREANITVLKIPPHTSHLLQPLDLAVNKSFKDRWDAAILKWQRMNIGKVLPKKEFAKMIGQIWNALDPAICAAGFQKGGIYPLNKLAVPENQFNQVLFREWKQKTLCNATDLVEIPTEQPLIDVPLQANHFSAIRESQEPRAGTYTQTDPVFEEKSPKNNTFNPDSLLKLSLNMITGTNLTQIKNSCSFHLPKLSQNTFDLNAQSVPCSTKAISKRSPNIQILENRIVTFEDLLLMRIKEGTSSKVKRKRMATGAEVITSDDVYKRTQEAEKEKQEKKNKTKQQEKRVNNTNKIEGEKMKDSRQHKKIENKKINTIKKCRKGPKDLTTSSDSETEVKYDEDSDGNDYWEELLNGSNEEDDEEYKEKKNREKWQEKRTKNKNEVKEEKDSRQHNKIDNKKRKTIKKCRKRPKVSTTSSESETEVKYDEDSDGNDYWEELLNGSNEEDDEEYKEKKNREKWQEKRTKNKNEVKEEKDSRQHNKIDNKKRKTIKKCRKRPKVSTTSSESETEVKYDEDSDGNDYWEELLNGSNEEDDEEYKEKKNMEKQQEKRTKNRKEVKEEKNKDSRQHNKVDNQERKTIKKSRKRPKNSTTASESKTEVKYDEDSNGNYYWDLLHESNDEDVNTELFDVNKENCNSNALYSEGDWLLVKFCTTKSIKHYVGEVLTINEGGAPVVKYARKKSKAEGETIFTFPVLDDISEVKHTEDIVTKLPKPVIGRRGQIIFKMTFNSFNMQ